MVITRAGWSIFRPNSLVEPDFVVRAGQATRGRQSIAQRETDAIPPRLDYATRCFHFPAPASIAPRLCRAFPKWGLCGKNRNCGRKSDHKRLISYGINFAFALAKP
jgi:hypothetical protein